MLGAKEDVYGTYEAPITPQSLGTGAILILTFFIINT
jgi:hypothetical protein